MRPILLLTAVLALVAAACGDTTASSPETSATTAPPAAVTVTTADPGPPTTVPAATFPEGPSALDSLESEAFPPPLVDLNGILPGGPPPDGIPPIDSPAFISPAEGDAWLEDAEAVIALEIDGDARAYPVQILIWHEIVNDVVGGVPVSITYCPLCNSAVTYRREIDAVETTFGTSGLLFDSALVMYDRATESLWTHFDGRAVVGVLTGVELDPISSPLLAWGDFKAAYPEGLVLDRAATGHDRSYGTNPYVGYDDESKDPFLFRGAVDDRTAAMRRVVGIALDGTAAAWALDGISGGDARATNTDLDGRPLAILWKSGQVSALDEGDVASGTDVGSVAVFDPVLDGRRLTFRDAGDRFTDAETGSIWDITGTALEGELAGARLDRVPHLDTFWFAWATYRPGTTLTGD